MVPPGLPVFTAQKGHASAFNNVRKPLMSVFACFFRGGGGDDLIGSWMDHYPGPLVPAAASHAGWAAVLISRD